MVKLMNYKPPKEDRVINQFILGFLSTLGAFIIALAGTFILGYFFTSLGYSTIVTIILYGIFVLHFSREINMRDLFKKGYWTGSIFLLIMNLAWIIFGGLRW